MENIENTNHMNDKKLRRMNITVATVLFVIAVLASITPFYYLAGASVGG